MEKKIGKNRQLSYQSHAEIVGAIDRVASRLAERRSYLGKKVGSGACANALILWYARLDEEAQDVLMDQALNVLEDFEMGRPIRPFIEQKKESGSGPKPPHPRGIGSKDITPRSGIKAKSKDAPSN